MEAITRFVDRLPVFKTYFWEPSQTTLQEIYNGVLKSFTQEDIKNCGWNFLICSAPAITGYGVTALVNETGQGLLPEGMAAKKFFSTLIKVTSFIIGAAASYYVASRLSLVSFSAEKALKFSYLPIAATAVSSILPMNFYIRALFSYSCRSAAAGYFGQRSLYVIGALASLMGTNSKIYKSSSLGKLIFKTDQLD